MAAVKVTALLLLCLDLICCSGRALASSSSLKFAVLGDWGGLPDFPYRTLVETAVASQLGKVTQQFGSQFNLALGDNFYFDGVKNVDDPRFKETFESVFTSESLQNPWYFLAGNHDHNGNVSGEIAYSAVSHRWNFPNFYYNLTFRIPGTSLTVDIVMIDTVILCGNTDSDFSQKPLRGPSDVDDAEKQWDWIGKTLQASNADYLLVAGHYPVWSVAEHGPTQCLVDRLMPLLMQNHATAYLCGHDHNLQHFEYGLTGYNIDYFVVGAANFIDGSLAHESSVPTGSLKYHWANKLGMGGFGLVEASAYNMTFTFVEATGKVLYTRVMPLRKMKGNPV
ncbi:tartrate-resistant acid phosphatase type 5-like [Liolophura sinensis]|uniref:tartrate-resistant acid phosphatase type 5-like n=1 Tax=Liolophura sinensis TaxID=3198878 RepID=UPI00315973FB